ncbi:serum opacification factor [Streptococcus dysgalactiae]|uniref:serum opacification factor n=1 Tax=Streptococcus dysgalactiae TaxID=1334 RepID=UPI001FAA1CA1|nr:serum opacification factor [Streptococcus dysgalactiae]
MTNCKYKLRKLSIGLVSVGTMFMAAPVMGEDASQPTAFRETPSASSATTSPRTQTEGDQESQAEALTGPQPVAGTEPAPASQTSPSPLTAETAKSSQKEEKAVEKAQEEGETSVVSDQADVANTPALANSKEQARPRSIRSAEATPQSMEAEKLEVDNESSKLAVKDGEKTKQLIKHRDSNQRDIFDVSRDVKVNQDGTMNVTLTVKPKEIDKGTEVIVLLDTSKEMTEDAFNTAKENIKKLVITLTGKDSKNDNKNPNYNNRNSVRLIDFYRKIGEPINLSGLDADKVEEKLNEVRKKAQEDYNGWGVNLQGAIHRARQAFNSVNERSSGKRQHIVLFSQGEATQSYDVKDKKDIKKLSVDEPVTSSNPLLPWPFYLDNTTRKANLVEEGEKLQGLLKRLGIKRYDGLLDSLAKNGNSILNLGRFVGIENPLNFITMSDLDTKKLSEDSFDYTKKVGEGYHHRSYYVRESGQVPLDSIIKKAVKAKIEKLKKEAEENSYDIFGLSKWATSLSKVFGFDTLEEKIVNKVIDYLFYKRNYVYYNHNLSAQAEAKMAREEGINFYVFDVTDPERRSKTDKAWPTGAYGERLKEKDKEARELAKKRNEKFDKYLEEMSEGQKFFTEVANVEKFKDILTDVELTETFTDKVTVEKDSWKDSSNKENVQYQEAKAGATGPFSLFLSATPESLTWTLSKDKLQAALQSGEALKLTYKLKVDKDKIKSASQKRAKRSVGTSESKEPVTAKVISGKVTYKINDKDGKETPFGDVNVTYSKVTVPVPDIEEELVPIPEQPQKPLVEIEIGGQDDIKEFTEVTQSGMSGQNPNSVEGTVVEDTQTSQEDIILGGQGQVTDFTEDTQSGMSGDNSHTDGTVLEEDSKPSQEDEVIIGGQDQVIDFIEDTQSGMSGDNSHTDGTVLEEDSKPSQQDEVIIGGQGQVIDFTEDTQIGMSGAGQVENPTITEETHKPEIIMGGQSDPIDMVEDTLPGMSGSNEATVVEEDTRPKLQFHFDNEEPVPATVPTVSQTPIAQVESKVPHAKAESALPQTGDTNKLETFFTITALTVIGAAGLLGKKRRNNQTD